MEIAKAVPEDAAQIGRLHAVVHKLHVDRLPWHFKAVDSRRLSETAMAALDRQDMCVIVARIDGTIVGYAKGVLRDVPESVFAKENGHLYIDQIAVAPAFRRKGVGRKLVEALCDCARREGFNQAVLDTWEFNDDARRFFSSIGFGRQMQRLAMRLDEDAG